MTDGAPILEVADLEMHFPAGGDRVVHAVDGVSLTIGAGEVVGLVGESGQRQVDGRQLHPAAGRARRAGTVKLQGDDITHLSARRLRPLRRQMHMVFQDPFSSLNPRMTTGGNVGEPLRLHGDRRRRRRPRRARRRAVRPGRAARRAAPPLPARALRRPAPAGRPRPRAGLEPSLLIADEPVSALDVSVQASILNLLRDLQEELELRVPVHHPRPLDRRVPLRPCRGHVPRADPRDRHARAGVLRRRRTPTRRRCCPRPSSRIPMAQRERASGSCSSGDLPSPLDPPSGCRFRTRCPIADAALPRAAEEAPVLRDASGDGHLAACHLVGERRRGAAARRAWRRDAAEPTFTPGRSCRAPSGWSPRRTGWRPRAGMATLERGGNAFDAAVAAGFVLQVVEPHLNGPGGDVPILSYAEADEPVEVICGQGVVARPPRPSSASEELGLDARARHRAAGRCVPGAFDAWMLLLRDHGTLARSRDVAALRDRLRRGRLPGARADRRTRSRASRSCSGPSGRPRRELWLPGARGRGAACATRVLAGDLPADRPTRPRRRAATARRRSTRRGPPGSEGFVAEAIVGFLADAEVLDSSGRRHRGLLSGDDLAGYRATVEAPVSRSTTTATRSARPGRGARARCCCSSSRCSRASTSPR